MERVPMIALAMGDPAGIGPEVSIKALQDERVRNACRVVLIGDSGVLTSAPGWKDGRAKLLRVMRAADAAWEGDSVPLVDLANVPDSLPVGIVTVESGRASMEYLRRATEMALAGEVDGVVFAPLNKEAMKLAGMSHHDEYGYFAELCGVREEDYTVLMVAPHFSLASVTLHLPLGDAVQSLTPERVLSTIRHANRAAIAAGAPRPRIGVAALNPHAGEHGTLGSEEEDVIRPAIVAAQAEGIDARGPFPADTFFMSAKDGAYEVYVGMYHDQGRIALKMLDFGRATTMAEGLPVAFSTVGHGSAYDIAGKGIANHENLVQTLLLAAKRAAREG